MILMRNKPFPIGDLIQANTLRWNKMVIHPERLHEIDTSAKIIMTGKQRFQAVGSLVHVPWEFIGIIASREYGFLHGALRWDRSLAQGDPWNIKSIHRPKDRGPFDTWEAAAQDALVNCPPHAAQWRDWTIGGELTIAEQYNGLGYAHMGLPSPYIWAGTDQYIRGKYDRDGHYDPMLVDTQIGFAPLLSCLYFLDRSIANGITGSIHSGS